MKKGLNALSLVLFFVLYLSLPRTIFSQPSEDVKNKEIVRDQTIFTKYLENKKEIKKIQYETELREEERYWNEEIKEIQKDCNEAEGEIKNLWSELSNKRLECQRNINKVQENRRNALWNASKESLDTIAGINERYDDSEKSIKDGCDMDERSFIDKTARLKDRENSLRRDLQEEKLTIQKKLQAARNEQKLKLDNLEIRARALWKEGKTIEEIDKAIQWGIEGDRRINTFQAKEGKRPSEWGHLPPKDKRQPGDFFFGSDEQQKREGEKGRKIREEEEERQEKIRKLSDERINRRLNKR